MKQGFKKSNLSLKARKAWTAQLFLLPFYLGFLFFFLYPAVDSIRMSFSDVTIDVNGYSMKYAALSNYRVAFLEDANFSSNIVASISRMFWEVPVIVMLSLFLAMLVKPQYRGRTFVRAVFFMPVIFASGIAFHVFQWDNIASNVLSGASISGGQLSQNTALNDFLVEAGISEKIVSIVTSISGELFSMLWRTGLQMIIFLAGLHSISPSLYEASAIEGSNAWDDFWKITLPMLSRMLLLNVVYTIIDGFTIANNPVMRQIVNLMNQGTSKLGLSSAFAWSYFIFIALILVLLMIVVKLITRGERRSTNVR